MTDESLKTYLPWFCATLHIFPHTRKLVVLSLYPVWAFACLHQHDMNSTYEPPCRDERVSQIVLLDSITQTLIGSGIGVLSDYNLLLLFQFLRPTATRERGEGGDREQRWRAVRMGRLMNSGGKLTFLHASKRAGQEVSAIFKLVIR